MALFASVWFSSCSFVAVNRSRFPLAQYVLVGLKLCGFINLRWIKCELWNTKMVVEQSMRSACSKIGWRSSSTWGWKIKLLTWALMSPMTSVEVTTSMCKFSNNISNAATTDLLPLVVAVDVIATCSTTNVIVCDILKTNSVEYKYVRRRQSVGNNDFSLPVHSDIHSSGCKLFTTAIQHWRYVTSTCSRVQGPNLTKQFPRNHSPCSVSAVVSYIWLDCLIGVKLTVQWQTTFRLHACCKHCSQLQWYVV